MPSITDLISSPHAHPMPWRRLGSLSALAWALALAFASPSRAQLNCNEGFLPSAGLPGATGFVTAAASWDPDGLGPADPILVVSGSLTFAGRSAVTNVAAFANGQWGPLGGSQGAGGLTGNVNGLLVHAGSLYAWGVLTSPPAPAANIVRWNGAAWQPVPGISGTIGSLCSWNGLLIAGGSFRLGSQSTTYAVAAWNGSTWTSMVTGLTSSAGVSLLANVDSNLYCNGPNAGSNAPISRWDGTRWIGMGADAFPPFISRLVSFQGLLIGMGSNGLYFWNGLIWALFDSTAFDSGLTTNLLSYDNRLFVCGSFNRIGVPASSYADSHGIAAHDGARWQPLEYGLGYSPYSVQAMCVHRGRLVAVGGFNSNSGSPGWNVAAWDGRQWGGFGEGFNGAINDLCVYHGSLFSTGWFFGVGEERAAGIAQLESAGWRGTDPNGLRRPNATGPSQGFGLSVFQDRLYAVGSFESAGGVPAQSIASWDGISWRPAGAGITNSNSTLPYAYACTVHRGELIVGGRFDTAGGLRAQNLAGWNGESWRPLSPIGADVNRLYSHNGELFVFSNVGLFHGTDAAALTRFTTSPAVGTAMCTYHGDLYLGGSFGTVAGVASEGLCRWDGTAFRPVPGLDYAIRPEPATVTGLCVAGDELIVAGAFDTAGSVRANRLAAYNADTGVWRAIGPGLNGPASRVAFLDGVVHLATGFTEVGAGQVAYYYAGYRLTSQCCTADINHDGQLTPDDLADYVACYFSTPPCEMADYNTNGSVDPDDLADYITAYFAGC